MLTCPECGTEAILRDTKERYGRSYGMEWVCPNDPEVFVGCHDGTDHPKGTLSGPETRELRKQCHARFDALWRGKPKVRRRQCYAALAQALRITVADAHIGMMGAARCREALEAMPAIEAVLRREKSEPVDHEEGGPE